MSGSVLVLNAGSSSIKYELIDIASESTIASGLVERIGESQSRLRHRNGHTVTDIDVQVADHHSAVTQLLSAFDTLGPRLADAHLIAVGHRVVMGGQELERPVVIDDGVLATIERLAPLAPLHNPANAAEIRVARSLLSGVPHVAVFDTAFFHDLPEDSSTYAIDRHMAKQYGIRRYGFHGISHQYVSAKVSEMLDSGESKPPHSIHPPASGSDSESVRKNSVEFRQIVLHLGNGASASAVVGSRPVDTSMGFTPMEGLVMGTRPGDIDPSVAFYLHRHAGMSIDEVDAFLNHRSGMKGLTGHTDMRDVHRRVAEGDSSAELGLAVYVRRLQKYIGAYAAIMGGLDALTFTAGVGENDSVVRAAALGGLGFLGVEVDPALNEAPTDGPRIISTDGSRVTALVVPTREELSIARQVVAAI